MKTLSPEDLREAAKAFFCYAMELNHKRRMKRTDRKPKWRGKPTYRRNLDELLADFVKKESMQN